DEKFYLLSKEPSSVDGTIGWMKTTDVSTRELIFIDKDPKVFTLSGEGYAYDRPWGSRENRVFSDLQSFEGKEFYVKRTDRVRNGYWHYGRLENDMVWIYQKRLLKTGN